MSISDEFETPHRYVDLEHGEIAYWKFGEGPNVVLIHGWPLHGATWRNVIPELSGSFTCHVIDLPGTGHTRWADDAPFGFREHAQTISKVLDILDIDSLAFVAHDSGATMTRLVDTMRPGQVWAHVMGNTEIPGHVPTALRRAKYAKLVPGLPRLVQLAGRTKAGVRQMWITCFADLAFIETDYRKFFVDPMANDVAYVRGQMRLVHNLDVSIVEDELAGIHEQITAPVLLLWGERDPWFPWKVGKSMVDSFGGPPAKVHLWPKGRLFVHEEFAPEFGRRAAEFLLANRATERTNTPETVPP